MTNRWESSEIQGFLQDVFTPWVKRLSPRVKMKARTPAFALVDEAFFRTPEAESAS